MFENSLIELDTKRNSRGLRYWIMPVALGLHFVVGAALLLAQYWNVPAVPEPPINVVFMSAAALPPPPPPPPPPAPPRPTPQVETPQEVPRMTEPVQPVEIPEEIPEPSNEPVSVGVVGGVEGGVEGGVVGGTVGGVVGGTPGGVVGGTPGGVVVDDAPLRVGGGVSRPEKISGASPIYTEVARRARVTGVVIVEAVIDENGNVTNARVLKGLPMGLDRSALDAVERWKFRPAQFQGRAVKVYYTLTVNFQVQ